ncbi:unnamed protein product [Mytilus coruscus]|uniref:Uncharacterized protein n=1 Tax=Mytilus coruscus TaxID=42192 RepID=A0A6J8D2V8_MYTCO|nr:unnamed protein product [Mytilus coruscus]
MCKVQPNVVIYIYFPDSKTHYKSISQIDLRRIVLVGSLTFLTKHTEISHYFFNRKTEIGRKMSGKGQGQASNDNKSAQCNPTSTKYEGHQSGYTGTGTKSDLGNHSNQLNPNNQEYKGRKMSGKGEGQVEKGVGQASNDNKSDQCNPTSTKYEGHQSGYTGTGTKPDLDNHSNQLNPNNQEYKGKK